MKTRLLLSTIVLVFSARLAIAADHRVEPLAEPVPADAVAPELAALMNTEGVRVIRGTSRAVCDLWICQQWPVAAFEPTGDVLYPFQPGQLIGVVRYPRKGSDFRDQEISEGVYTLRYGQQPVDGAHVGTSPTRDFLLLIPANEDKSLEPIEYETLTQLSAKVSGTAHPALLSLQRTAGEEPIRNVEERDWWIVRLNGNATSGGETKPLPIDLVVVGQAE
jgi:hypothetical protein